MIRFQGTITARSPITVIYPDQDGLPRTPHGDVVLHGGTFRGPLRKAAYHALRVQLAKLRNVQEDQVFSLADAYMLGQGVDTSRAINNESDTHADPIAEQRLRELNPMLNLFGRWKLPGRLAVGEMRAPETNVMTAGAGARRDMFEADAVETRYLPEAEHKKLLAQLESERISHAKIADLKAAIRDDQRERAKADKSERATWSEAIKEKDAQIKAIKNEREGAVESVKHPLSGFEAIAPGSELSHTMTLINGTDTDLGLTLIALAELAREPFIGGHRATGCGEFEAHWDVLSWPAGQLQPDTIGTIEITPAGFSIKGNRLEAAPKQFAERLAQFDFSIHTLDRAKEA